MNIRPVVCPYCGSGRSRLLSDQLGNVGWCSDCHRTWLAQASHPSGSPPPRCNGGGERERRIA